MDVLIKDVNILDGRNNPPYKGNVGIKDGKIILENLPETAEMVIDGRGKYLSPGFIDSHSHGDLVIGEDFANITETNQGVTTQIAGQCGMSMGPINPENIEKAKSFLNAGTEKYPEEMEEFRTWGDYLKFADQLPKVNNYKLFIGYNIIRISVMGFAERNPTEAEMEKMKDHLKNAMENGALGMSTGLVYAPGPFTTTEELIELSKVMVPYGGIYSTHIRNESFDVVESVREAIEIGREAGVAVNISHHKVMGKRNWGLQKKTLEMIEEARAEGIEVTCDQYPYNRSMTHLYTCVPPWHFNNGVEAMVEKLKDPETREKIRKEMDDPESVYENTYLNSGGWDGVFVCSAGVTQDAVGMTIIEYAEKVGKDPFDAFFDLLIENKGVAGAVYHCIGDEDIYDIIKAPFTTVSSDGLTRTAEEKAHPRGYGTMPHAICAFTKDTEILSLEEMIWKITGLPAAIYKLDNKGVIEEGYDADLVIFDYEKLRDRATYTEPTELADGIEYVFINGELVMKDKELTENRPGKILRHKN